jgi:hypothetical protein
LNLTGSHTNIDRSRYKKAVLPHGYYDDYFAMEEANAAGSKL